MQVIKKHLFIKCYKINILLFQYFIIVYFLFSIYSCNDNLIENPQVNYNIVNSVSGEVLNLPSNAKLIKGFAQLKFENYIIDTCIVDSSNSMFLNLVTLPENYLFNIAFFFYPDTTITISDLNAKVNILRVAAYNDTIGSFVGEIMRDNHFSNPYNVGFFQVNYIFSNKNVSIRGDSKSINNYDTTNYIYDINLGAGWNAIVYRIEVVRGNYKEIKIENNILKGSNWYFLNVETQKFLLKYN